MHNMRVIRLIFLWSVFALFFSVIACTSKDSVGFESPSNQELTLIPTNSYFHSIPLSTNDPYSFSSAYEVLYETPVTSAEGLNSEEILVFLISKWLEEKTQTTIPGERISEYFVNTELNLKDWKPESGFILVASVRFFVVPETTPNNWGSILLKIPKNGDVWWHLALTFGLENDGVKFILRNAIGWGT